MQAAYERLPKETDKAWAAFVAYRDAGEDRGFTCVAKGLGKSGTMLRRWAKKYEWPNRIQAWENQIDSVRTEATLNEVQQMRQDHLRLAGKMRRLAEIVIDQKLDIAEDEARRGGLDLSVDDARKLTADAAKLERSCLGEPEPEADVNIKITVEEKRAIFRRVISSPKAMEGLDQMMGALDEPGGSDTTH